MTGGSDRTPDSPVTHTPVHTRHPAEPAILLTVVATSIYTALSTAGTPVLVHCGSGNRVGALFALRAAWLQGVAPAQAVALGRAAGMTALEPAIRGILGA